jgi:hypothetical protein
VRTVLPPIAALTAVCISIPAAGVSVANAASTDDAKGPASHSVAAPQIALAAATSDLKLVLANVGSNPGLGAAVTNAGQKLEILALPTNLADNVSANGTGGLPGTVLDAGRQAAANILAAANQASLLAPTASLQDNVVSRALTGLADIVFWLSNSNAFPGTLPTGFDTATYTSLFKVAQNLVNVAVLPFTVGNLLLTGQFDKISTTISNSVGTLFTSAFQGLPTSIAQTVNWVLTGQTPAATMLGAAATMQANTASLAAAADPTASLQDNVVSRALTGTADFVFWLSNSNAFPGTLPTGFDTATYTSLFKVAQNLVNVAVLPFTVGNLLLTGQFDKISTTISNSVSTLFTSVFQGLPTSFVQTVGWVLTGQVPAATAATMQANTASLAAAADPTASQGQSNAILTANTITTALTSVFQGLPTSVFQGLPTSFAQTLDGILTGQTPADMGVKATENSLLKAPATGKAVQQDVPDKVDGDGTAKTGGIVNGGGDDTNPDGTTKPGGILSGIVNGGGATNPASATKPGGVLSGITNGGGTTTKPGGVLSGITKGAGITKSGASATAAAGTTDQSGDTGNKKDGVGKHRRGD